MNHAFEELSLITSPILRREGDYLVIIPKVAAVVKLFCTIVTIANTLKDDRILLF